MAKKQDDQTAIIARLVGHSTDGGWFYNVMIVVGAIVIVIAVIFESSAIRLAAWGTIWTGWNVLWGIGILQGTRTTYIVYREERPPV